MVSNRDRAYVPFEGRRHGRVAPGEVGCASHGGPAGHIRGLRFGLRSHPSSRDLGCGVNCCRDNGAHDRRIDYSSTRHDRTADHDHRNNRRRDDHGSPNHRRNCVAPCNAAPFARNTSAGHSPCRRHGTLQRRDVQLRSASSGRLLSPRRRRSLLQLASFRPVPPDARGRGGLAGAPSPGGVGEG
jgi:hypothetical protein